jgi:ACS family tartrate transporter-like MFS transporter
MNDDAVFAKCAWRLIPFIFILYLVNFIDRVNVGFAALTMNGDLKFSPAVFGFGGGIFFLGYSLFQIPANLILERVGARRWIFLILLVWGAVSASTAFITNATQFYAVRVLLGIAEAGFFPGMVLYLTYWFPKSYRARLVANFMLAIPFANIVGGPVSGLILGMDGVVGLHGWQWLFLIEGTPACAIAFAVLAWLPSGPAEARWLNADEKRAIAARLATEESAQHRNLLTAFLDLKVWALGLVYLGYAISYYGVQLWLPQIVQAMGFSNLATSFLVALPFVATMIAMFLWGRSSDSTGERIWHVAIPALIAMASLIAASIAASNLVIFLALTVAVMSLMSLQGPFWALPQSYLGGVAAAGGIALINTLGTGAGGFLGPYVVGLLKNATGGYAVPIGVLAIAPAMTAIVVLSLKSGVVAKPSSSLAKAKPKPNDFESVARPVKNA